MHTSKNNQTLQCFDLGQPNPFRTTQRPEGETDQYWDHKSESVVYLRTRKKTLFVLLSLHGKIKIKEKKNLWGFMDEPNVLCSLPFRHARVHKNASRSKGELRH